MSHEVSIESRLTHMGNQVENKALEAFWRQPDEARYEEIRTIFQVAVHDLLQLAYQPEPKQCPKGTRNCNGVCMPICPKDLLEMR